MTGCGRSRPKRIHVTTGSNACGLYNSLILLRGWLFITTAGLRKVTSSDRGQRRIYNRRSRSCRVTAERRSLMDFRYFFSRFSCSIPGGARFASPTYGAIIIALLTFIATSRSFRFSLGRAQRRRGSVVVLSPSETSRILSWKNMTELRAKTDKPKTDVTPAILSRDFVAQLYHPATLSHKQELTNQRSPHFRDKIAQNRALL